MAREPAPSASVLTLVRLRDQLNDLTVAILPSRTPLFQRVSLALPDVDGSPELAFIRTASWLYVHYFEAGQVGVRFLVRRNATVAPVGHGDLHLHVVHALRTWAQHNINPTSESDVAVAETCEQWFERACGTRVPRTDEHWKALLDALLSEAAAFLERLQQAVSAIESDEDRSVICGQWEDRLTRDWPAHRFHSLIASAASDLGRDALDPVSFYARHGHALREGLKLVTDDSDLDQEARKLVERALLSDVVAVLPITGHDVLAHFDVVPGPEVGRLLECARRLYDQKPCDKDTLLGRMTASCGARAAGL